MKGGPFAILLGIITLFITIILIVALSQPIALIYDTMETAGNDTDTGKTTGPNSVKNQTATWNNNQFKIFTIIGGIFIIGCAIAIFLAVAQKMKRPPQYYESERYGGDYEY